MTSETRMRASTELPEARDDLPPRAAFRIDVEGLRAVTALLVAGFHIWGSKVSGGVDVFFVVSGYFITLTLLGHIRRYGTVRVRAYLARLAQRLAPMTLMVLTATMLITWFVLGRGARGSTFEQVIASLLSLENVFLAFQSIDYLGQTEPKSPVQQFWAMSVQGQFYLIWLVVVIAAVSLARRYGLDIRRSVGILVAVLAVTSFAWSMHQTSNDQAFAYFSPLTRVWEFGIGAGVALVLPRVVIDRRVRIGMAWLGLAGVITCAAFMPVESAFPGAAALWPTLSAALILLSGQKGDSLAANAMLNQRVLVWMGSFAFAIYLWHWPLLIAARWLLGQEHLGWKSGLVVILAAILLAWVTSKWLERPVMQASRSGHVGVRRRANLLLVVAFTIVLVAAVASLVSVRTVEAVERDEVAVMAGEGLDCFGARAVLAGDPACRAPELGEQVVPLGSPADDLQLPELECAVKRYHADARMCAYGAIGADTRIGLVGNSHAIAWFPALERIALEQGWELRVWYKNGCQFASPQRIGTEPWLADECAEWVQNVQADILAGPSLTWIMTSAHGASAWAGPDGEASSEAARAALSKAWTPLIDAGTDVVVVRDYPKSSDENLACVERRGVDAVDECARARADVLSDHDEMFLQASALAGAHGIDLTDAICDSDRCWTVAGHVKVYRDRSHLSNTFAASTSGLMADRLREQGLIGASEANG
ncbi:acyltransferase family protein [Agromyces sp. H66]|uniref:acyltransferase family protein n=1 Tax=Agromyces sp. H66 TaxID=2529859 RepID=UPI00145A19B1|nr:acyltransferase family protein [Agromyces sp. H66]